MNNKTFLRRDLDLWEDRRIFGKRYTELSDKYRITPERCRQIFLKTEKRFCQYLNKNNLKNFRVLERKYFDMAISVERGRGNEL